MRSLPGLDIHTALLITGLVGLILFLCLAYVCHTRQTYPGFRQWTLASLLGFFGIGLLAFRDVWPDLATIVPGNSLIIASMALYATGLRAFLGKPPWLWLAWVCGLIGAAVCYHYGITAPSLNHRVVLLSLLVAAIFGYCAYLVHTELPRHRHSPNLWLTLNFGLFALWFLVRCFLTVAHEPPYNTDFLASSFVQSVSLLVQTAGNITITLGLLILNLARTEADMHAALAEVRTLRGVIPICSSCKKIRDDRGAWNQLESYISEHSGAQFSHGYCPECAKRVWATLNDHFGA